ncbi:hypothetical protein [Gordonia sp. (in: high G+C Gram-positive bacteria)]|uniref:hypothetical protein n=1 Tax=Gordonia sp. (in: high G+C Gram-positive bacteria) TaxID=84139 RepID=UPI003C7887B2
MTEAAAREKPKREWLILVGLVICPILSLVAVFVSLGLRTKLIAACEPFPGADSGPGEGWYILFLLGPGLTVVSFLVIPAAYAITAFALGRRRPWVPMVFSLLVTALVIYLAVLYMDVPGHTPDCPSGRPPWWPSWLPISSSS